MDIDRICRICLHQSLDYQDFEFTVKDIEQFYLNITDFELEYEDDYPKMVCNKCYAELERYSNFKENLLQKEEKFKESFFKIQEIGFKVEDTYDEEILVSMDEEQFEMVEAESEEDENHKVFIKLDGEEVEVEIAREEDPFNLKCGNCNVVLPSFKEYKDHAELCQQEPMDEPQAKRRNIMSTERKNKSLLGRRFCCAECDCGFSFRVSLKRHMQLEHNIEVTPSTCLICSESFNKRSDFLAHMTEFHRPNQCGICLLSFKTTETLNSHILKNHIDEKFERKFKCEHCLCSFKRKEHLKSHIAYKHQKFKQHKCLVCDSTFSIRQDLRNHEKVHSGQRPLKCYYCSDYDTRDLKSLKRHCLTKHDTKEIYRCEHCTENFEKYRDMQEHKKNHETK